MHRPAPQGKDCPRGVFPHRRRNHPACAPWKPASTPDSPAAAGSNFPLVLELRCRSERALTAVIQEAHAKGVNLRQVDYPLLAVGMAGMKESAVSTGRAGRGARVTRSRQPALTGAYSEVWLPAMWVKVRDGDRALSMAYGIATRATADGDRAVLGCDLGPHESKE